MSRPYTQVSLDEIEDIAPGFGLGERWEARAPRTALEAEDTGFMHVRLRPGKRSPFAHRHANAEEIYVILSGSGRMKLDDHITEVRQRDAVRVAPAVTRAFEAGAEGLEYLAFGAHHPGDGEVLVDPWCDDKPSAEG